MGGSVDTTRGTTAASAGSQIVDAIAKGTYKLRIGGDAKMLDRLSRLMPQRATAIIADQMAKMLK